MKMELTEHDIRLLKLSASVLIAFLMIRLLLMPAIGQFQENSLELQELDETIVGMQASMDAVPLLEQKIADREEEREEISSIYYEHMENHQVDELLTGLALKHGLFPVSLSIEGAAPGFPAAYLYGVTAGVDRVPSDHYMETAAGSIVLRGAETGLYAFLNDVENDPALRLSSFQMSEKVYLDEDWNLVGQPDMSCSLEIYMHEW